MASLVTRLLAAASCVTAIAATSSSSPYPDPKAATKNAFALFNSIHSAMRQFGSSVHHNGMSFYLAQAPEGSVFYHGDYRPDVPPSYEWLAFEVEHAYAFAKSWEPRENLQSSSADDLLLWHRMAHRMPPSSEARDRLQQEVPEQYPLSSTTDQNGRGGRSRPGPYFPDLDKSARGYFHTYIANRPLNLLYIDGEGAAKCYLGPMDSQDFILLDWSYNDGRHGPHTEWLRATDLCALAKEWQFDAGGKIDGFVRMEAGFEIIYCDFFDGLDQLSVQASPFRNETGVEVGHGVDPGPSNGASISGFEWLRAVAARFQGHPAGRLDIDWSSMVSAFAYPINMSNPNADRQDLPRVVHATRSDRQNIRCRLRDVVIERGGRPVTDKGAVNWQSVVDKIVTRFSKRLWWLGNSGLGREDMISGIGTLIDPFISYLDQSPEAKKHAIERCARHYVETRALQPGSWTPEDRAVAAGVGAVSSSICTSLFSARAVLRSQAAGAEEAAQKAQGIIQDLIADLRWSTWKECEGCGNDEICFLPMFPVGGDKDYFHPSCQNVTSIAASRGYWGSWRL